MRCRGERAAFNLCSSVSICGEFIQIHGKPCSIYTWKRQDCEVAMPARSSPKQLQPEDKEAHERALDETLAETFPASDPLSSIPDPAIPDPASDDPQAA
jgi:hypothetical protein